MGKVIINRDGFKVTVYTWAEAQQQFGFSGKPSSDDLNDLFGGVSSCGNVRTSVNCSPEGVTVATNW